MSSSVTSERTNLRKGIEAIGGDPGDLRAWGYPDQQTLSDQIVSKLRELKVLIGQV